MNADEKAVEQKPKRRGPGRPKKSEAVDDGVTPQHNARMRQVKEAEAEKKKVRVVDKYYLVRTGRGANKLLFVREKSNGKRYTTYIGRFGKKDKRTEDEFERIKAEGNYEIRQE